MGRRRLVPTSEPRTIEDLRLLQAVGRGVFRRRVDPEEALQVGMFYFLYESHMTDTFFPIEADLNLDEPDELSLFDDFVGCLHVCGGLFKEATQIPQQNHTTQAAIDRPIES